MDATRKRAKKNLEIKKDSDLYLRKHVGLIHCENKLTLMQRKICNILLFNALDKIDKQDIYEISLRQLCSLVGYNSNDIQLIKQSIKSLISVVMEWNLLEDNKFLNEDDYSADAISWNASALLAGASIKSGVIRYSYSPQMKSVLSSLDIYGRINLFVQSKFNSMYSLVLYENCVRFKNIKQTAWFPMDLFRSLMGVSEGKYRSFKEFKRNVITVAVNEINRKADITIEAQYKKSGRYIASIQFLLSENENYKPTFKRIARESNITSLTSPQSSIAELLISEFNLSAKQSKEITSEYSSEYLLEKINLVRAKHNIDHSGAYLISALKKDYKIKQDVEKTGGTKNIVNLYQREAKEAYEITSLKNKYMTYKLNNYINFIDHQALDIQVTIREKFELYLKPKIEIFTLYRKKGLFSPFVMIDFMEFVEKNFPNVIGEFMSFDDYITSDEVMG
ncbi:MAG: replication initiation protein [Gammaproteobacteria bacterium]|nr:replication initiation protein [Gammaproteobacteria bacterium]